MIAEAVAICRRFFAVEEMMMIMSRKQTHGYWFYNVGSIGPGCEYYYTVKSESGMETKHLIQGGKEVYVSSHYIE